MKSSASTRIIKFFLRYTICAILCTALVGCATVTQAPLPKPKNVKGIYHQVQKGQTLWRISKIYNVDIAELAEINYLPDTSRIYVGQLIFIPNATSATTDLLLESDLKNRAEDFVWPTKGKVSLFFGMKRDRVKNEGIYIQARNGTNVIASRSGKVAFCSEDLQGYGKIVILDHLDGYSTVYAHNSINLVVLNSLVKQGQVIARAGTSGRQETPELYFEIRKGQKAQNPFFYLP